MFSPRSLSRQLRPRQWAAPPPWMAFNPRRSSTTAPKPDPGEELSYPPSPTSNHDSLSSFLQYAETSYLSDQSPVFVGTRFEYMVAEELARYRFSLRRVGGTSDYGIDLLGTWAVPSAPAPLRVLLQCKANASKLGPSHVRELEGAFVGAPPGWRGAGVMGLLVGRQPATKGVRDSLGRSRWPMGYISCDADDGRVGQMLWNRHAADQGLDGLGISVRQEEDGLARLVLTFKRRTIG